MKLLPFVAFLAVYVTSAIAADASPTAIDLSPLLNTAVETIAGVLAAVAAWATMTIQSMIKRKIGLQIDDRYRALVDQTILNGINYAKVTLEKKLAPVAAVDLHNAILKLAADYVVAHSPDALGYFNIDAATLERKITAMLPTVGAPAQ